MVAEWTTEPVAIGEITRYRVQRADKSESKGIWDRLSDASALADLLNSEELADFFEEDEDL